MQAAVPFYGVYDLVDEDSIHLPLLPLVGARAAGLQGRAARTTPSAYRDASPVHRIHGDAPPFLVIHGERGHARRRSRTRGASSEKLREASDEPVVYAELRGGQHAFDFVPSPRTAPVVEAIERFLHTVRQGALTQTGEEYASTAPDASRARGRTRSGRPRR